MLFHKKLLINVASMTLCLWLLTVNGYAETLTVKLKVSPEKTEVYTGSLPLGLTAETSSTNVQFTWKLDGPGQIDGTGYTVLYLVPKTLDGASARVAITVNASDASGQKAQDTLSLTLLPNPNPTGAPATDDGQKPLETKPISLPKKSSALEVRGGVSYFFTGLVGLEMKFQNIAVDGGIFFPVGELIEGAGLSGGIKYYLKPDGHSPFFGGCFLLDFAEDSEYAIGGMAGYRWQWKEHFILSAGLGAGVGFATYETIILPTFEVAVGYSF